jgi:putative FmdB family regulatory protein
MPTYEYICQKCGKTFEVFQSMKDAPLKTCTCGKNGRIKRLVGRGAGIIFKGSGFYENDYKRHPARSGGDKSSGDTAGKSDSPAAPSGAATAVTSASPAATPGSSVNSASLKRKG